MLTINPLWFRKVTIQLRSGSCFVSTVPKGFKNFESLDSYSAAGAEVLTPALMCIMIYEI